MGFFDKIKQGLTKTRDALSESWNDLFSENTELDEDFYDELEESLILADMGVETAAKATEKLRKAVRDQNITRADQAKSALRVILTSMVSVGDPNLDLSTHPSVILVIGVNGVGKTTTIGGIVGTVVNVKENNLVIETGADQVRVEIAKWAMSTNETAAENARAEAKKAQEAKAKAKAAKKAEKEGK